MRMKLLVVVGLSGALAACGTGRMLSYGTDLADAKLRLGAAEFQVYAHPKDDTLLVQRSLKQISSAPDLPVEFNAAASQFLAPIGCTVLAGGMIAAGSFEYQYQCPAGTDLRGLVSEQRDSLRAGAPLRGQ